MKRLRNHVTSLRAADKFNKIALLLVVLVVAGIGTYVLSRSSAITPTANIDAGTGSNVSSPATIATDPAASGGSYIQFGSATPPPPPPPGSWWKPTASAPISWNWVIGNPPPTPYAAVKVYDIDGFDNSAATVAALHAQGSKVICYIDVGTYEPGRPDLNLIPAADIGSGVQGWPGEKWLNIADIKGLTPLVTERMKLCQSKGFDAIEPDNIDGYTNSTGFALSGANQIAYNQFLATTAHGLGLSIGLKNDVDQTSQLVSSFDWALDEECNKYTECNTMAPFTNANKAVFNAEYTSDGETTAKFCSADVAAHINGVLFDLNLDGNTFQPCTGSW